MRAWAHDRWPILCATRSGFRVIPDRKRKYRRRAGISHANLPHQPPAAPSLGASPLGASPLGASPSGASPSGASVGSASIGGPASGGPASGGEAPSSEASPLEPLSEAASTPVPPVPLVPPPPPLPPVPPVPEPPEPAAPPAPGASAGGGEASKLLASDVVPLSEGLPPAPPAPAVPPPPALPAPPPVPPVRPVPPVPSPPLPPLPPTPPVPPRPPDPVSEPPEPPLPPEPALPPTSAPVHGGGSGCGLRHRSPAQAANPSAKAEVPSSSSQRSRAIAPTRSTFRTTGDRRRLTRNYRHNGEIAPRCGPPCAARSGFAVIPQPKRGPGCRHCRDPASRHAGSLSTFRARLRRRTGKPPFAGCFSAL
jgi:hypothetical protein